MNCPVCNCPVKVPRRAKQHVGRCRTCKAVFRATRFEHSVQLEHLPSKTVAEAEAIAAGREESPALWRWTFRLATVGLLIAFAVAVATEVRAAFEVPRRLARAGRIATAKVFSPYMYLPGPTDAIELEYEYEAGGGRFGGAIRSESLYEEPTFEVRTKGVKVAKPGQQRVAPPDESANYAGIVTVTYLPSDPAVHQVGIVPAPDLRETKVRLGVGFLLAFMGVLLWWFSFRLGKIPRPRAD